MAQGKSGRIVIEVNPELKKELYSVLAKKGITLKEWFIDHAKDYLTTNNQLNIFK